MRSPAEVLFCATRHFPLLVSHVIRDPPPWQGDVQIGADCAGSPLTATSEATHLRPTPFAARCALSGSSAALLLEIGYDLLHPLNPRYLARLGLSPLSDAGVPRNCWKSIEATPGSPSSRCLPLGCQLRALEAQIMGFYRRIIVWHQRDEQTAGRDPRRRANAGDRFGRQHCGSNAFLLVPVGLVPKLNSSGEIGW